MPEVAVGNVDGVLVEVRELAQALIGRGAAETDREARFPDEQLSALGRIGARAGGVMAPTNGVLRTWSAKAIAGLPVR